VNNHQIRVTVLRLERYLHRAKDKIWSGDRQALIDALAEIAEAGEIARRLCLMIQKQLYPPAASSAGQKQKYSS
jgi:hypothetical protein